MSSPYSSRYYEGLKEDSAASARAVVPLILQLFPARTVIDVGCGSGTWARAYLDAGCEITGVDGHVVQPDQLLIPVDRFQRRDLAQPLALDRRFDLVNCLEVAEHLDPSRGPTFAADLCKLGDVVVFSAAVPFLFNLTYEYCTHGLIPGMNRVPAAPGDFHLWPFLQTASQLIHPTDPRRIDTVAYREALEDTYLGLAGAYLGATGRIPITFQAFLREFPKNPRVWIRRAFFD